MPKATKLPSGSWRARVFETVNGKQTSKSFTASTKAEAEYLAACYKRQPKKDKTVMTVREAVEKYIELSSVLSPVTIRGYRDILRFAFPELMDMNTADLTDNIAQAQINMECRRQCERTKKALSPKTVKNEWGLVAAALRSCCGLTFNVRLPKQPRKNSSLPEPGKVMQIIKGSPVELPCMLAMWCSLRMSEVRGLMCSSIKGDMLSVDSVIVDIDGLSVRKELAKTDKSIRRVYLPAEVKKLAESADNYVRYIETGEDAPLVSMTRNQIHHYFSRLMKEHGIDMTFHDLRHMYASIALNILKIPERFVMDAGGWATPNVMKQVYSQSFDEERRRADRAMEAYLNSIKE